MTLVSWC